MTRAFVSFYCLDTVLPTADFPWFADARVVDVYRVELHHGHVLHGPALDVDLDVANLDKPEDWPLVWRA